MNAPTSYRPDIDGLRAIAVLSVVFFHFGIWPFSGGFTGVDTFFVISGFLITSLLYLEVRKTGTVSLRAFFERRARRILPALIAVVACSLIAGFILLLPDDYSRLGAQSAASVTGWANFYFLSNSGYFGREATLQPLLHMWSLAVEEQFYIVWPILLMFLVRISAAHRTVLAAFLSTVILVSLGASIYTVWIDDAFVAFFMPYTRAWELALGALIVFLPSIKNKKLSTIAAVAGFVMVAYAIFALSDVDPFPGMNAVYPCLGTALLIWPRHEPAFINRILSLPPIAFTGLISYSLYLWHWPVLVFFRIYAVGHMPNDTETALLLLASVALAVFSWKFIETPFRAFRPRPVQSAAVGSAAIAGLAAVGILILHWEGLPERISVNARHYAAFLNYKNLYREKRNCAFELRDVDAEWAGKDCSRNRAGTPDVLLVGDSHASHFGIALQEMFPDVHFFHITHSGCRPVVDPKGKSDCVELMHRAYGKVIPDGDFDAVILSARWRNGQSEQVRASVAYLRTYVRDVIVFGQTMEYRESLPAILIADELPRRTKSVAEAGLYEVARSIDRQLRQSLAGASAKYFSVLDAICPGQACMVTTPNNVPFQRDYGHLTHDGALYVLARFKAAGLRFNDNDQSACDSGRCRSSRP